MPPDPPEIPEPVYAALARSPGWPRARAEHLESHPACAACRRETNLHVHHEEPVHENPARELDPANLMTLCGPCHLVIGHLNDWNLCNPGARADAAAHLGKVRAARRKEYGE